MTFRRLLAAVLLFVVNLWVAQELLTTEYLDHMGSIEGTHITIARWVLENWRDLTWFPLWYGGIPFQNTYPPLHHMLVALVAGLGDLTPALAYHATTAVFFSLGPVTLFLLALRLSRSLAYSFGAALFYSLVSPSAFLISAVRHSVGGLWNPRRLQALVQYGEGPHVASMTLLPLALLLLVLAFEKRRPVWWLLAALGLASVPLTNWLGAAALAMAVAAWLLARQEEAWWKTWLKAIAVGICAYAIASPWIPPSTISNVQAHEKYVGGALSSGRWIYAAAAAFVVIVLLWLFWRFKTPVHLRFSILFLFPVAVLTLSAEWAGIFFVSQPQRYHLEMEMGLALALAFAAKTLLDRVSRNVRVVVACALILLCVYPALRYRNYARRLVRPIDVRETIEYREAQWFGAHMNGRRVFAHGSVGFFLNVFTNTPQYAGGFDQGVINPVWPHVHYQILSGDNAGDEEGQIALLWLRAYGVDAVSVSGPHSKESFKPFRNPRKFDEILPELWRDGDDVIYEVPRRSRSLAHVIRREDLPARQPENGLDVGPVRPYVAALENPALPLAEMSWRNHHAATISADMTRDQNLSVQVSYHPGWRASINGRSRRVYEDHLGQIVIEPRCDGRCTVDIHYDGGREMVLARFVSWSVLLGGLAWIVLCRWRGRRRATISDEPAAERTHE